MERQVNLYPYDYNDNSMFRGKTWDECVFGWIKGYSDRDSFPANLKEPNEAILSLIKREDGGYQYGALVDLVCESLTLESSFAKELKIYDVFDCHCFIALNETGENLIKCFDGLEFMVYRRVFSKGALDIDFVVFEQGSVDVVINNTLFQGKISQ